MIDWLLDASPFMPRGNCGQWTPALALLYAVAGLAIAMAYAAIPLMLYWTWRRYRADRSPRQWQVALFATFIFLCGVGHIIDGPMMFFYPAYRLATAWHCLTAIASWATLLSMPAFVRQLAR